MSLSELQISCVFAFFTIWKRVKTQVFNLMLTSNCMCRPYYILICMCRPYNIIIILVSNRVDTCYLMLRNFIENKFVNRKLEKRGWSVPRAPVIRSVLVQSCTYFCLWEIPRNYFPLYCSKERAYTSEGYHRIFRSALALSSVLIHVLAHFR
jgi:hypothetical protein